VRTVGAWRPSAQARPQVHLRWSCARRLQTHLAVSFDILA